MCNEIEGITKNPVSEMLGLVDLGNEAATCAEVPKDAGFYSIKQGADVESITKYLERPIGLFAGAVGTSPGNMYSYNFDTIAAYRNAFRANHWDRLKGAVGIRATLVFTLNVTSSAFNQGIVALAYQYGVQSASSNMARHNFFPLVTNLPHVRLNLASTTMVQLEVPYVSAYEYIPIDINNEANQVDGGVLSLTNLTGSRVVAGQDAPRYTLYVSMKDIEIIGAAPNDVITVTLQAGDVTRHTGSKAVKTVGMLVKGVSEVTKEARDSKIVSNTLSGLSKVARVASYVPGLGAIGGTVDWFASYAAKTAKSLGYSKPLDENVITRVNRYAYGLDGQVDVPSNGVSLAPFQGNKVNIGPDLGMLDDDEMQLDYILGKYQYIYHGRLTNSAAIGDTIYGCPVCPTAFWFRDVVLGASTPLSNKPLKTSNVSTENAFLPSTLCYVADSFRFWRGSFKFRVSFAKTKMHGGRVQFNFVPYTSLDLNNVPFPGTTIVPQLGGFGPAASGYSYIFDLRDADEFEFEVPYISNQPYMSTYRSIGDVSMMVVVPLKGNATVPNTVDFMVEVAATPDFELAVPSPSLMAGVAPVGTASVTYQSGLDLSSAADDISQQVVGERFASVKQIIMMPDYFPQTVANNALFTMNVDPWFKANSPALATPMPITSRALWFASRSSKFANLYAFARGSTMLILQKDGDSNRLTYNLRYSGNLSGQPVSTFSSFYDKENNPYSTVVVAETMESTRLKIPVYGPFARYDVADAYNIFGGNSDAPNTNIWNLGSEINVVPRLNVRNNSGTDRRVFVGRAAADDATLARFVGPPPCTVFNSLATNSPVYGSLAGDIF